MFGSFLEECVGMPDAALDERLRANELELRRLMAERAALLGVAEHRGIYSGEHRSMAAYLRATLNCSDATATRDRKLGRLVTEHPEIGDALRSGHITVEAALQICRVQSNTRIRTLLPVVVPVLVDLAEHSSHRELADEVTNLIAKLDQDGAFADTADSVAGRRASVVEVGGTLVVTAHGGDPVQAAQVQAVFESFVAGEYRNDVEMRRAMYGDDADQYPLPRTRAQRGFDALYAIVGAAAASPEGRALPEPVVNLLVDGQTAHDTLAHAGIVLPNGDQVELDDDGTITDEAVLLDDLASELADDPEGFLARRCETAAGSPIHPSVVLRALLTGHVRRVVMDSRGVIIDYGTKQRLFAGLARQAAMLLARTCEFPGCTLPASWSQVDHNHEWAAGGRTDQRNANIGCGHHNRVKHRERWRTRRSTRGRAYTIRADGTVILPVGERPPDLSIDEQNEQIRQRLQSELAGLHLSA
jgi:hypothetical protein